MSHILKLVLSPNIKLYRPNCKTKLQLFAVLPTLAKKSETNTINL